MSGPASSLKGRLRNAGGEVFEIQPVILGGSPTDPKNKTILTRAQHIEAVRYWNNYIRHLRAKGQQPFTPPQ